MLYWGIKYGNLNKPIGFREFQDDQIIFYNGMFGVPNYIVWHAATWPQRPEKTKVGSLITFFLFKGSKNEKRPVFKRQFVIKNFIFDTKTKMFKIVAIDRLHYELERTTAIEAIDVSKQDNPIGGEQLIEEIVKDVSLGSVDVIHLDNLENPIKYFELSVDPEMSALDLISKICNENYWEWYYGYDKDGEHIYLGCPLAMEGIYALPFDPGPEHRKYIESAKFINISMDPLSAEPTIEAGDFGRIIWVKYYLNNVSPQMSLHVQRKTGGKYNLLTEFDFINTLEGRAADFGRARLARSYRNFGVLIGKTYGEFTDDHRDKYEMPKFSGDPKVFDKNLNKRSFRENFEGEGYKIYYTEDKKLTTPYAGDGVGALYPQADSHKILFSPFGERDASLAGPSYFGAGDEVPKRDNVKDFRLQLPGGSIYVTHDGDMKISPKSELKITVGGIDSTNTEEPTSYNILIGSSEITLSDENENNEISITSAGIDIKGAQINGLSPTLKVEDGKVTIQGNLKVNGQINMTAGKTASLPNIDSAVIKKIPPGP